MPKVGEYLHDSTVTSAVAGINNAFNAVRVHQHDLYAGLAGLENKTFQDRIESITVAFSNVVGATTATIRVCLDSDGDYPVIPDTTSNLAFGITTATEAVAAIYYGAPVKQVVTPGDSVWVFVKLDAGGATWEQSCITWSE